MKTLVISFILFVSLTAAAQLKQKSVEKNDGVYTYCYHSNGKESTVEFRPSSNQYMAQGFSKAYDKSGKLIYEQITSRTGVLSGVHYTYYANGAVKSATYSSHPDAGIQWYKKYTYFDENGSITNEMEMSDDMRTTIMHIPDTSYLKNENDKRKAEDLKRLEQEKNLRNQFIKDSTLFFTTDTTYLENDTLLILAPNQHNNSRTFTWKVKNKIVKNKREYFQVKTGILSIECTFFKNGHVESEITISTASYQHIKYNKRGEIIYQLIIQDTQ